MPPFIALAAVALINVTAFTVSLVAQAESSDSASRLAIVMVAAAAAVLGGNGLFYKIWQDERKRHEETREREREYILETSRTTIPLLTQSAEVLKQVVAGMTLQVDRRTPEQELVHALERAVDRLSELAPTEEVQTQDAKRRGNRN